MFFSELFYMNDKPKLLHYSIGLHIFAIVSVRNRVIHQIVHTMKKLFAITGSVFLVIFIAVGLQAQTTETFDTPGVYDWDAPAGVTQVTVEVWGAGGGGGDTDGAYWVGSGGGGGGYSKKTAIPVTPLSTYTVYVGSGGTYGNSSGKGGDSWFNSTSTVLAKGGTNGSMAYQTGATPGQGGEAADGVGDIKYSGGDGDEGYWPQEFQGWGGGGGSSAGTGAHGNPATDENGATAPAGGGDGGDGSYYEGDGENGDSPGGGGGGARGGLGGAWDGGDGGHGKVILTYQENLIADLSIEKTASDPPHYFGDDVVFTIVVTNSGPDNATNVNVQELPGSGFLYVSHVATLGTFDIMTGIWNIPLLGYPTPGIATLTITATILPEGEYHNGVVVSADELDENTDDNEDEIVLEPEVNLTVPLSNWALFIGIGLIIAFMVIRFRRVL